MEGLDAIQNGEILQRRKIAEKYQPHVKRMSHCRDLPEHFSQKDEELLLHMEDLITRMEAAGKKRVRYASQESEAVLLAGVLAAAGDIVTAMNPGSQLWSYNLQPIEEWSDLETEFMADVRKLHKALPELARLGRLPKATADAAGRTLQFNVAAVGKQLDSAVEDLLERLDGVIGKLGAGAQAHDLSQEYRDVELGIQLFHFINVLGSAKAKQHAFSNTVCRLKKGLEKHLKALVKTGIITRNEGGRMQYELNQDIRAMTARSES